MVKFPFDECTVLQNKFNFDEIVREKSKGTFDEEPLFICDVSDVLTKYKTWTKLFPRVIPFFGKCDL